MDRIGDNHLWQIMSGLKLGETKRDKNKKEFTLFETQRLIKQLNACSVAVCY